MLAKREEKNTEELHHFNGVMTIIVVQPAKNRAIKTENDKIQSSQTNPSQNQTGKPSGIIVLLFLQHN